MEGEALAVRQKRKYEQQREDKQNKKQALQVELAKFAKSPGVSRLWVIR
jgi:hypothetical protein